MVNERGNTVNGQESDVRVAGSFGTIISSLSSLSSSSFVVCAPSPFGSCAAAELSSWQYIEGPESAREMACSVIAGYSTWNPRPVVDMNTSVLKTSQNDGLWPSDDVFESSHAPFYYIQRPILGVRSIEPLDGRVQGHRDIFLDVAENRGDVRE